MESRLNDSTMTENTDVVASGAIGSQLVSQLVAEGHEVVGTTRSDAEDGVAALRHLEDGVTS